MQEVASKIDWAAIITAASQSWLGILALSLLILVVVVVSLARDLNKRHKLGIVLAMFLLVGMFAGIGISQGQKVSADEVWTVREGNQPSAEWKGSWRVKNYGEQFECREKNAGTGAEVAASCVMVKMRGWVAIKKFNASDQNICNYFGSGSGDTFSGYYICTIGGKRDWSATVSLKSGGG